MSRSTIKGQGHRGQKNEKVRGVCPGVVLCCAVLVWHFFCSGPRRRGPPPVLRRWENQRMLCSSISCGFVVQQAVQQNRQQIDSLQQIHNLLTCGDVVLLIDAYDKSAKKIHKKSTTNLQLIEQLEFGFVSDIAIFVLKRDVKLQLTN